MWTVDKPVERFEGKNVYSSYPQNCKFSGVLKADFIHGEK